MVRIPSDQTPSYKSTSKTAEKPLSEARLSFNKGSKTFRLLEKGNAPQPIQVSIPQEKAKPAKLDNSFECRKDIPTKGVGKFFSGDVKMYSAFLSSLKNK